ncbi:MAG: O-antigen ligase family protein [Acidimicrobiales bacterium]|nr:MAG: O-antigen ligase family protein [Acidimicrobiales bacterium]
MRFAAVVLACMVAINPWGWDRFGPLRFALVSTVGFAIVAHALWTGRVRTRPEWVTWGWALILGGTLVSAVLSEDRWHAFVGTPDRHFGFFTWLLLAALFFLVQDDHRPVLWALSIGAAANGAYVVFELFGVDWFDLDFANDRAGGLFAQPALLGAAMVLCVPSAGALALSSRGWVGSAAAIAAGLGIVGLLASQSRAAWVGAAVAVGAVMVLRRDLWANRWTRPVGAAAVILIALVALATPLGSRAWSLTDVSDGVVAGRIDEWQVGSRALFASTAGGIIGVGPETYRVVFPDHVDAQYIADYGDDVITDRAHNSILDTALAGGIPAGVGLVIVHLAVVAMSLEHLRGRSIVDIGLGVAAIAYVVQQLFMFPAAEVDPAFWIVAGLLWRREEVAVLPRAVRGVSVPVAAALATVALVGGVLDVAADQRVSSAIDADLPTAIDFVEDARTLRPDSIRYDFISARLHTRLGTISGIEQALERISDGLESSPQDPALLREHDRLEALQADAS